MTISVEVRGIDNPTQDGACVELFPDNEGIDYLVRQLTRLKDTYDGEHAHLMSPAWGGNELQEAPLGADNTVMSHLKIIYIGDSSTEPDSQP